MVRFPHHIYLILITESHSEIVSRTNKKACLLQAYLTGRIQASGDVKKLMLFDKLSRKGHRSGSMFNV